MKYRMATQADCALLAGYNHQLIQDEGHRNAANIVELEERMRSWLAGPYRGVLFLKQRETVAYALYREDADEIYLRHLFVVRNHRREGVGRVVIDILRSQIWPTHKRLTVEVLVRNTAAVAFWRSVGYQDYSLKMEIQARIGA